MSLRPGWRQAAIWAVSAFVGTLAVMTVPASADNDLREFRVGMKVGQLPQSGYQDFACADAPSRHLAGWSGFAKCPKDALGLHPVSFRYAPSSNPLASLNEDAQGTKVGGHPVLLSLLIADDGRVEGLRIVTDPHARLYLHKKAFLLAEQVRARYGEEGWRCEDAKPHEDEVPIGGVFIDRSCTKTTDTRRVQLNQKLYRIAGKPATDFVNETEVTILAR